MPRLAISYLKMQMITAFAGHGYRGLVLVFRFYLIVYIEFLFQYDCQTNNWYFNKEKTHFSQGFLRAGS